MGNPLTKLQHRWVAIEVTPVDIYRRANGEIIAMINQDKETQIQVGCTKCDTIPEEGWHTVCPGEME